MKSQNPPTHFVIDRGGDRFDVITGYKLNDKPLDLAAANQIACRSSCSVTSVAGSLVTPYTPPTPAPIACSDDHDRRRRRDAAADAPRAGKYRRFK
jgi:hypothetical protein